MVSQMRTTTKLVSQVHDQGATLTDLLWSDSNLRPFLNQLTETQRQTLQDSTRYIGASVELTIRLVMNGKEN